MRKLFVFLFLLLLKSNVVGAVASFPIDLYKVTCSPETKEFRVDVLDSVWYDGEKWKQQISAQNLHVLNKHFFSGPKPETREEVCVIDDVTYKMKFIPKKIRMFEGAYSLAVQLFANYKYLGVLFPLGYLDNEGFDSFGIKNENIELSGCVMIGANRHCLYKHWSVPINTDTSYEFGFLSDDELYYPKPNVVELKCFDNLLSPFGQLDFHYYPDGESLPKNYYRFNNTSSFSCGKFNFQVDENGVITVAHGDVKKSLKLNNCNQNIFKIKFDLDMTYFSLNVDYYNQIDKTWGGTYCYDETDCMSCDMYPRYEE